MSSHTVTLRTRNRGPKVSEDLDRHLASPTLARPPIKLNWSLFLIGGIFSLFKRELRREVEASPSKIGVANNGLARSQKARSGRAAPFLLGRRLWQLEVGWDKQFLLDGELRGTGIPKVEPAIRSRRAAQNSAEGGVGRGYRLPDWRDLFQVQGRAYPLGLRIGRWAVWSRMGPEIGGEQMLGWAAERISQRV